MDDLNVFNDADTNQLLSLIEAIGGQTLLPGNRRPRTPKWGKTTSSGLGANTHGMVWIQKPSATGWDDSHQDEAWNRGEAIAPYTVILLIPIDGRYCVFDPCVPGA